MNFYLSAVDAQLRHPSEYKLTRAIPAKLKSSLPTIKELEKELSEPGND